ncbi:MAG: hypothetical protein ACI85U_002391, partial [Candidatus Promineifilaceae bacterium]
TTVELFHPCSMAYGIAEFLINFSELTTRFFGLGK